MAERTRQSRREDSNPPAGGLFDDDAPAGSVDVVHGPYRETLPVAEMTVGEVRRRFQDHLDIHPDAVAHVGGQEVGDDTRLRAGEMLMFVRPAGEKGALPGRRARAARAAGPPAIVTIEGDEVRATLPEGAGASIKVSELVAKLRPRAPDSVECVLPDGVKSLLPVPGGFIAVHQTPPTVFSFRWIAPDSEAPFGPGTTYRRVRLALPYVIVLAVFDMPRRGVPRLSMRNECFFSNLPLETKGLSTELCFPALLNCSRFADDATQPLSWICTQHLPPSDFADRPTLEASLRDGLAALLRHLFESGFNQSSEHHEASSWFSETVEAGIDPRLASVEDWEKASAEDAVFVLDVPWLPTGLSLAAIVERIASRGRARRSIESAADLARIVLNAPQGASQ